MTPRTLKQLRPKDTLPKLPSKLIEISLSELRKIESDPRYQVNMNYWHVPLDGGECHVCLAGAVMAGKLRIPVDQEIVLCQFSSKLSDKLVAIDYLRQGYVGLAFELLGLEKPSKMRELYQITSYHDNRISFLKDMRRLQNRLVAAGF